LRNLEAEEEDKGREISLDSTLVASLNGSLLKILHFQAVEAAQGPRLRSITSPRDIFSLQPFAPLLAE
jgi:hypothetical protein